MGQLGFVSGPSALWPSTTAVPTGPNRHPYGATISWEQQSPLSQVPYWMRSVSVARGDSAPEPASSPDITQPAVLATTAAASAPPSESPRSDCMSVSDAWQVVSVGGGAGCDVATRSNSGISSSMASRAKGRPSSTGE